MTVDFEAVNKKGTWFAYAIMVAEYPSGKLIDIKYSGCERDNKDYDEITHMFWNKHQKAHEQLINTGKGKIAEIEELLLCEYISEIVKKYPKIYVISDNPQYDIRLLDNMLQLYNFPPISVRGNKMYFQCICTWSFKMGIIALFGKNTIIDDMDTTTDRQVDAYFGPRHTPKADCARIISQHFKVMDIIYNNSKIN